jgi:sugar phosphate isomerase/epimerase
MRRAISTSACVDHSQIACVLGSVHLSDSNRHQPGAGHVPFDAVIAMLAEVGFEGVLSVECRLRGPAGEAVAATGRLPRDLLDGWPLVSEAAESGPSG